MYLLLVLGNKNSFYSDNNALATTSKLLFSFLSAEVLNN